MKLPVWIIAVAMVIAACFIGYGIFDNREVDLWPPKIHPKLPCPGPGPLPSVKYLKNFSEVLEKAAEVIEQAEQELWIAVDVEAYGAISQPQSFPRYETALLAAATREQLKKNVLWFSNDIESKYNTRVAKLTPDALKSVDMNIKNLRHRLSGAIGSDLPVLAFNNFWLSKDNKGVTHVVITWIAFNEARASTLVGIYTQSQDVATLLISVWEAWHRLTDEKYSASLLKMYEP